jgi:ubiquinone biosynthesis protein COQ9
MLQDSSINHEKTWLFLKRRIEDGYSIHEMLMHTEEASHHLQQAIETVFVTARNILGSNFSSRR